ncbi:S-adenosyl-L-methionine-dependent methyltransferase [Kockovaella imperatae]|uniref:S-adenosyl-L-methionine-dependent methyltransferase n=1 Tax=Kockovaella imperatae TaxID=4999 RepID=A0A1Y1UEE7_9TREE|nr:S-adenosyl-L-methionine-dependent methyltransferase [Kockovaella imperatae]ORX35884.1 S-adenosyl-L-methionine-dependent methyltransferase [Kockovaella imperatae]
MRATLLLSVYNRKPIIRLPRVKHKFMESDNSSPKEAKWTLREDLHNQPDRAESSQAVDGRRSRSPPSGDRQRAAQQGNLSSSLYDQRSPTRDLKRARNEVQGNGASSRSNSFGVNQSVEHTALKTNPSEETSAPAGLVEEDPTSELFTFIGTKAEVRKRKKSQKRPVPERYSAEDVLEHDIKDLLGRDYVESLFAKGDESEWTPPGSLNTGSHTVRVSTFTVSGDGLALYQEEGTDRKWAILIPFAHPGDLVECTVYRHRRLYSAARLLETLEYNEEYRGGEGDRRKFPENGCKYFGKCGGCQLQPIPYERQLEHKKRTVELAYKRYSHLSDVPAIRDTIPSQKQWQYRTKITPHFDEVPKRIKELVKHSSWGRVGDPSVDRVMKVIEEEKSELGNDEELIKASGLKIDSRNDWELKIGFNYATSSRILDIEECPIATPILNAKLPEERKRVKDNILSFPRGATLLLRDSLEPPLPSSLNPFDPSMPITDAHIAVVDHKRPVYEQVGDKMFTFPAGSFFQNNNSILPSLVAYTKEAIFPSEEPQGFKRPTQLVDAYCGSGFFGVSLSDSFERVAGVELDLHAVEAAKKNAQINGVYHKSDWLCAAAEEIFANLPEAGFHGSKSCVIIDPPRKGCDEQFLRQLYDFKPITIVYVSCNVHTQARDIGWFIHHTKQHGVDYKLESIRGFDLFPQTAHVESVAVLRLVQ